MADEQSQPTVRGAVMNAVMKDLSNPDGAMRKAIEASGQGGELPQLRNDQGQFQAATPPAAPPEGQAPATTEGQAAPAAGEAPRAEEHPPAAGDPNGDQAPVAQGSGASPDGVSAAPPSDSGGGEGASTAAPTRSWDDFEQVEYEDPELGEKIAVWAPKEKSGRVKDGYALKAMMSRHATYLGKHKSMLEPLIASGQFDQLAPYIQRALSDPQYAQALVMLANGQVPPQFQQTQPVGTPPQAAPPQSSPTPVAVPTVEQQTAQLRQELLAQGIDEYTADAIVVAQKPIIQQQVTLMTQQAEYQRAREAEVQRQAEYQRAQAQITQTLTVASQQLAIRYPGEFTGNPQVDEPKMQELFNYAKAAGFDQVYGVNPAVFIVAKQDLEAKRAQAAAAAPVAQPASALAASARALAGQAGQAIADRAAATVVNRNAAAPPPQPPKDPLKSINTKGKSIKQVTREVAQVLAQQAS